MQPIQLSLLDSTSPKQAPIPYRSLRYEIPTDLPHGTFISIDRATPLKIHSLGFQPAKTIPEIPRWFIKKYTQADDIILEPFAGSGTSLIEGLKLGRKLLWLDYHPLSRLICRVKTRRISSLAVWKRAKDILKQAHRWKNVPTPKVHFRNKDFWFQKPVQEGLEILREQILASESAHQMVLWLAFAATVRKCSDMDDGMILAARRSNVREIPQRTRADVFRYFQMYIEKAVKALAQWQQSADWNEQQVQEIPTHDARHLEGDWQCNAVITSPPYINAIDYVWAAKFELHWLGLVENDRARLELYSQEIGTERIPSTEYKQLGQTGYHELDSLIKDIYTGRKYQASKGQNELRARVVFKYFNDMTQHFKQCYRKLHPGGFYCFAIGDVSKICGVDIPVAVLLTEFAQEVGFQEIFRFHLLLKNRKLNVPRNVDWASTIKHDTVVVLQKPS